MKKNLTLFILLIFLWQLANAQFVQQGGKLTGLQPLGTGLQGNSVCISGDGNTAVVGAPGDNASTGAVFIYHRTGTTWAQQPKLIATGAIGNARQGSGVAISSDGNTIAIGGENDNTQVGAVWIFIRSGGSWVQQAKLVGTGYENRSLQGQSVALSADGNTLIAGGYGDGPTNAFRGAAWVFQRAGGVWQQDGSKLVPAAIINASNAYFGYYNSVSISNDGNTAIIGSFGVDNKVGATWVYAKVSGLWSLTDKLVGSGYVLTNNVSQGRSVSISGDGATIMVGGPGDNSNAGAVWIFVLSGGSWAQQGGKINITSPNSQQGFGVSLSSTGNTAMFASASLPTGSYFFLRRTGTSWSQLGSETFVSNPQFAFSNGLSAALSRDGYNAVVGTPTDNSGQGCAYIFIDSNPGPAGTARDGDWHVGSTWESGFVPPYNAPVIIRHNVVVTAAAQCYSLHADPGAVVTISTGIQLKVLH